MLFISVLVVFLAFFMPQSANAGFRLLLNDPNFLFWLFIQVPIITAIIITIWEGLVFQVIYKFKLPKAKFLICLFRVNIIAFYIATFCAILIGILAGTVAEEAQSNILNWGIAIYMVGFFSYVAVYKKVNFFNKISENLLQKKLNILAGVTSVVSFSALLAFLYYELI